jgi:predicted nuclease of predicted toxin-antitoxin system
MKILVDMNLSPGWVSFLTGAGIEAVHWSEVGSGNAPDSDLMQWAAERGYIVLTADLDFGAILAASQRIGPSVIQVRNDILTPRAIGGAVVAAIQQSRQELLDGALVSVDAARARLRILPLRD